MKWNLHYASLEQMDLGIDIPSRTFTDLDELSAYLFDVMLFESQTKIVYGFSFESEIEKEATLENPLFIVTSYNDMMLHCVLAVLMDHRDLVSDLYITEWVSYEDALRWCMDCSSVSSIGLN